MPTDQRNGGDSTVEVSSLEVCQGSVTVLTMVSHDSHGVSSLPLISDLTFPFGHALFLDNYLTLLLCTCLSLSLFF